MMLRHQCGVIARVCVLEPLARGRRLARRGQAAAGYEGQHSFRNSVNGREPGAVRHRIAGIPKLCHVRDHFSKNSAKSEIADQQSPCASQKLEFRNYPAVRFGRTSSTISDDCPLTINSRHRAWMGLRNSPAVLVLTAVKRMTGLPNVASKSMQCSTRAKKAGQTLAW